MSSLLEEGRGEENVYGDSPLHSFLSLHFHTWRDGGVAVWWREERREENGRGQGFIPA